MHRTTQLASVTSSTFGALATLWAQGVTFREKPAAQARRPKG